MASPFVLITVPHALQPRGRRVRASDLAARATASELNEHLRASGVPTILLEGDVVRERCDLNRFGTCPLGTFQRRFEQALARGPAFVVDMHSYPSSERWQLDRPVSAVVMYDGSEMEAAAVVEALDEAGFLASTVAGNPGVNAILVSSNRQRVPAVLLEVNESRGDDEHRRIASTLARYLVRRLSI